MEKDAGPSPQLHGFDSHRDHHFSERNVMATVKEVIKRLKKCPEDRTMVVMIDGEFYDIDVSEIETISVTKGRDWAKSKCYHQIDEIHPKAIKVLAIM